MRILVTGHLGYIGAVLAPLLAAGGHEVAGFDADLYRGCDFGPAPVGVAGRIGDVRDLGPPTWPGSMRSSTWPRSRTIRSEASIRR